MLPILYCLIVLLCVIGEATTVGIPLTLVALIVISIFYRKEWIFFLAITAGILLDSLTFRFFGGTALFFLVAIGILFLYQKKFETRHMLFGISFTMLSGICYLFLFEPNQLFLFFIPLALCATVVFFILSFVYEHSIVRHHAKPNLL